MAKPETLEQALAWLDARTADDGADDMDEGWPMVGKARPKARKAVRTA